MSERKEMAEEGVKELILVAQETTVYGTTIFTEKIPACSFEEIACKIKNPLDPCALLLSGRNLR